MSVRIEIDWDDTVIEISYNGWKHELLPISQSEMLSALDDCYQRARRAISDKLPASAA